MTKDRALGMGARVTRRDFLGTTLLGSGAALLSGLAPHQLLRSEENLRWTGYSGEGDYRGANGNTEEVMAAAHAMRDGKYEHLPADTVDTGEVYDCVIVGGGVAGLSAALFLRGRSARPLKLLVLENHPIFGGEARRNDFLVDGVHLWGPQASNYLSVQRPGNLIDQVYREIALEPRRFEYQDWNGPPPALPLSRHSYEKLFNMPASFGFFFGQQFGQHPGKWVADPWRQNLEGCPWPAAIREDLLLWRHNRRRLSAGPFPPRLRDAIYLDSITEEQRLMEAHGMSREAVRAFIAPMVAQEVGLGPDVISGYAAETWADDSDPEVTDPDRCFPGGNAGVTRHLVKALCPDAINGPPTMEAIWRGRVIFDALDRPTNPVRIRLKSTAVRVEHAGDPAAARHVTVTYANGAVTSQVRAASVIMAGGGWAARRIVRDLPAAHRVAYGTFNYSAFLVANVAVRNWRFLHKLGLVGGRWFEGMGHWTEVRGYPKFAADSLGVGPDSPTVLTFYAPMMYPGLTAQQQGTQGRVDLLATSYRAFERRIRQQLVDLFGGAGLDPRRDIAGIVLNRFGHAFVNPTPGFFLGRDGQPPARDVIRNAPFGRIAFSHGDLSGTVNHMHSIRESDRAAAQVLALLA